MLLFTKQKQKEPAPKRRYFHSPSHDDEEVEPVPAVGEVGVGAAGNAHGQHLDDHLRGEEGKDNVIGGLEDSTARTGAAGIVRTGLVHAQRHAVEENGHHADALEPCVFAEEQKGKLRNEKEGES